MYTKYKVAIILAVLAAALGSFYFFRKPAIAPIVTNHQDKDLATSTVDSELKGWKIYKNEKYGFEFQYPADWSDMTQAGGQFQSQASSGMTVISLGKSTTYSDVLDHEVRGLVQASVAVIPSIMQLSPSTPNFTLNGLAVYKAVEPDINSASLYAHGEKFYVMRDQKTYIISLGQNIEGLKADRSGYVSKDTVDQIFNQIISTFKLTGQQVNTNGWETYRNKKYGFELKYPNDSSVTSNNYGIDQEYASNITILKYADIEVQDPLSYPGSNYLINQNLGLKGFAQKIWQFNKDDQQIGKTISDLTSVSIGTYNGYQFTLTKSYSDDRGTFTLESPTKFIFIRNSDLNYMIWFPVGNVTSEAILSTFKFTI